MALDQIGTMLSPCSPRISACTCDGRHLQTLGQVAAEAGRVELRAQAEDALPRQTAALHRQVRQHVHRVADDDEIGVVLEAGRLDLIEQRQEQIDVAVDEVEPALVGLAAQAGGDDDDVARRPRRPSCRR